MNLSTAVFLVNKSVRSVRVSYEPNIPGNPCQLFKTLDTSIKSGDIVIVPTDTRHKMTCVKVEAVDFGVDFDSSTEYRWIIGRVDTDAYASILAQEGTVISRVRNAEENRKRAELAAALKMHDIDFAGLDLVSEKPSIPAPASVRPA